MKTLLAEQWYTVSHMRNNAAFKALETALERTGDETLEAVDAAALRTAAPEASRDVTDVFLNNARRVILARREQGRIDLLMRDVLALVREAYPEAECDGSTDRVMIYLTGKPSPETEAAIIEVGGG